MHQSYASMKLATDAEEIHQRYLFLVSYHNILFQNILRPFSTQKIRQSFYEKMLSHDNGEKFFIPIFVNKLYRKAFLRFNRWLYQLAFSKLRGLQALHWQGSEGCLAATCLLPLCCL